MLVKKKVYICDHCGAVALQPMHLLLGIPLYHMPKDWAALGKEHLCPTCAEIYRRVSDEVKGAKHDQ